MKKKFGRIYFNLNEMASKLKEIRLGRKLKPDQVITELHHFDLYYERAALSKWENARTTPPINVITSLCQIYKVPLSTIMYGFDPLAIANSLHFIILSYRISKDELARLLNISTKVLDTYLSGEIYKKPDIGFAETINYLDPRDFSSQTNAFLACGYIHEYLNRLSTDSTLKNSLNHHEKDIIDSLHNLGPITDVYIWSDTELGQLDDFKEFLIFKRLSSVADELAINNSDQQNKIY